MCNAGSLPPFARLEINKATAALNKLPESVQLTLKLDKDVVLQSEHHFHKNLLNDDLQKLRQVAAMFGRYDRVALKEYLVFEEVKQVANKESEESTK